MHVHPQELILERARKALLDKTAAENRVYIERVDPWRASELPAIVVLLPDEETDPASFQGTQPLKLRADLLVEVVVQDGVEDAWRQLRRILQQVQVAMAAEELLGGAVDESHYAGAERGISREGQVHIAFIRGRYALEYQLRIVDESQLSDFEGLDTTHNVNGSTPTANQPTDSIELQGAP